MLLSKRLCGLALLAALLLTLALLPASAASAQADEVTLATLVVRVWPEYDEPAALVLYEGQVAPNVVVPADVRLPLPPAAALHAAAYIDTASGGLLMAQARQEEGEAILTTPNGSFWLEYYDPALEKEGETRRYQLTLTAPVAIGELVWEVEQPAGGRNLTVEPSQGGAFITDTNNLPAFRVPVGSVAAGETVTLRFSYMKDGDSLTVDQFPAAPPVSDAAAIPPPAQAGQQPSSLVLALILVGGLALVGGGVYWFVSRSGGKTRPAGKQARRQPARGGPARFCMQCGQPARAGDRFCRHCGAKLGG